MSAINMALAWFACKRTNCRVATMALDDEASAGAAAMGRKRWAKVPAAERRVAMQRVARARWPEAEDAGVDSAAGGVGSVEGSTGRTRGSEAR